MMGRTNVHSQRLLTPVCCDPKTGRGLFWLNCRISFATFVLPVFEITTWILFVVASLERRSFDFWGLDWSLGAFIHFFLGFGSCIATKANCTKRGEFESASSGEHFSELPPADSDRARSCPSRLRNRAIQGEHVRRFGRVLSV